MKHSYDIVIAGAGMAGAACANTLANRAFAESLGLAMPDWRIAVVEGGKLLDTGKFANVAERSSLSGAREIDDFEVRVSALNLRSVQLLKALDVWQEIPEGFIQAFTAMDVWDAQGVSSIGFSSSDVFSDQLGYVLENTTVVQALHTKMQSSPQLSVFEGVSIKEVHKLDSGEGVSIFLEDDTELHCQLLIAADGARSFVRESLGFETRQWSYQQEAIVCTVQMDKPHDNTCYQIFTPTGPLALLPLANESGCMASIVWSQMTDRAAELMALSDRQFSQELANAFEGKLGKVKAVSARAKFPLRQLHAVDYVQDNIVLVADAAHAIHPLAGQGINLGFADVCLLAELLLRAQQDGKELDDAKVLAKYQRQRKVDNLAMMAAMEAFSQLYVDAPLPVMMLRNIGMRAINKMSGVKKLLLKHAVGV